MSKQTATSLFMLSPLVKYGAFYQELLQGIGSYQQLGNKLVHLAEQAGSIRQFDMVGELGRILSVFPIKEYQPIGHYYLAIALIKHGKGDLDKAKSMLERVADTAPPNYKARAIMSLAAVSAHQKDLDSELYFFVETLKFCDITTSLIASRGIAVHKAREGYHRPAVKDLERMLPFIKYAPPHIYFDYLNSLAVELGEVGRKYEARNIIKHVIASPLVIAYPEWRDTAEELKGPNRSFVSVAVEPHIETVPKPKKEIPKKEKLQDKADVLPFKGKLKEAPPPPKPKAVSPLELDEMTQAEKRGLFLSFIHSRVNSGMDYDRLLISVGLVRGPGANVIDLDNLALIDDIISEWCNLIDPEQFSGVMSALRDCDDSIRRKNIMDTMISAAFRQTGIAVDAEEQWRTQVECRLPKKSTLL